MEKLIYDEKTKTAALVESKVPGRPPLGNASLEQVDASGNKTYLKFGSIFHAKKHGKTFLVLKPNTTVTLKKGDGVFIHLNAGNYDFLFVKRGTFVQ